MLEKNMVYNVDCIQGMKLIDDNSIDMVLTDPPFSVNYGNKSTEFEKMGKAAGFKTRFAGAYPGSWELSIFKDYLKEALENQELAAEHKNFIKSLKI